jgi:hypothetical protein
MSLTLAHYLYILGVIVVVATMIFRRNVVIPCILFTFAIGWYVSGNFITGIQTIFTANIVAAGELFSIFFIIGVMVALLRSLSVTGADELMVKPLQNIMSTPLISYLVIAATTIVISLFFWPTPAAPLIGALLVPVAIKVGLPPVIAAMALALAGQGLALGGDIIIQAAPGLTAKAAGVPVEIATFKGGLLTFITGSIALGLAYFMNRKEIAQFKFDPKVHSLVAAAPGYHVREDARSKGKFLALVLAGGLVFVVVSMFAFDIKGGDASGLLGGTALIMMIIAAMSVDGVRSLDTLADYVADGLVFAFKVMGPIIPIAGFFFLGSPEAVVRILGEGTPGFLFDVGEKIAAVIPASGFLAGFGMLILGMITGLDGSGFSGLPLVGTLAGALAGGDVNVASGLGAIGQMGAIWMGGGTLVAWSSLVAVAGVTGVPVLELVRKSLVPVISGLVVSTIVAVMFLM